MKTIVAGTLFAVSLIFPAVAADKKKTAEEPGITREQADAILNELRQIRELLEKNAASATGLQADGKVRVTFTGSPVLGNKNAPITVVEFTDYQCGFCQRFHTVTFPEIRKKFIDTGKVRFVSRDLPLEFHSNAFRAAQAARCAADQGQFWDMRDRLVANPTKLAPQDLEQHAQELKLNLDTFKSCLDSGKYSDAVKKDVSIASSLRIDGTPAFVIGKSTPTGVEGTVVMGALPLEAFEAKLNEVSQ